MTSVHIIVASLPIQRAPYITPSIMASVCADEKADAPNRNLAVHTTTTRLNDKLSHETLSSSIQSPSTEKGVPRASDASTPSTAHNANPFDTDIEAIITTSGQCNRKSTQCTRGVGGPDCQVWPGQDHWRRKAKAAKRNRRSCNCLAHLSKRNRILVKILIGLLIVGVAVGVGFGVSKPLGAPIWHPHDQK